MHKYDIVKIKSCTFLEFFIKIQLEFCIFKSFVCVREPATFGHSGDEIVVNHHMIFSILGFCFILSYFIFFLFYLFWFISCYSILFGLRLIDLLLHDSLGQIVLQICPAFDQSEA